MDTSMTIAPLDSDGGDAGGPSTNQADSDSCQACPARLRLIEDRVSDDVPVSWDWVPAAISGGATAAVGLAGITATFKAGKRQQTTALETTRLQIEAQLGVTREERRQRRAETAYLAVLDDAVAAQQWTGDMMAAAMHCMTRRADSETPFPTQMPLPSLLFDPPTNAGVLTAYWSPRVAQLVDEVRSAIARLRGGAIGFECEHADRGSAEEWRGPGALDELWSREAAVKTAVATLREHISQELNGLHDGTAAAGGPVVSDGEPSS